MTSQNRPELEPSRCTDTSARAEDDFLNVTSPEAGKAGASSGCMTPLHQVSLFIQQTRGRGFGDFLASASPGGSASKA